VTEDLPVDPVLAKSGLVLVETEIAKPAADIHSRAPHGLPGQSLSRADVSSGAALRGVSMKRTVAGATVASPPYVRNLVHRLFIGPTAKERSRSI